MSVSSMLISLRRLMDGLRNAAGVHWIGMTNRLDVVEAALADRPGRFDRRLDFGSLPYSDRTRLVERLLRPQKLTQKAHELATMITNSMTGSQIRDLAETLRIIYVKHICKKLDFNDHKVVDFVLL